MRRARTFFATKKDDKALEQVLVALDVDPGHAEANHIFEQLVRRYKPAAEAKKKREGGTVVPMNLSGGRVNRKVATLAALGVIAAFFMWLLGSTGSGESMKVGPTPQEIAAFDQDANDTAASARLAAQVFFLDKPEATLTRKDLYDNGFVPKPEILVFIDVATLKGLSIRAEHRRGSKSFIVDPEFQIKSQPLKADAPAPAAGESGG